MAEALPASPASTRLSPAIMRIFGSASKPAPIMLIRGIDETPFMRRFSAGIKLMASQLGMQLIEPAGNGVQARMPEMLDQAIARGVRGIVLSHGIGSDLLPGVERALAAGIAIVSFDTLLNHAQVPEIEQDDMAVGMLIGRQLAVQRNGSAKVIYINDDAYVPLAKRDRLWQAIKWRYQGLHELRQFGTASPTTAADTAREMADLLETFPEADTVLAMWSEFARGAYNAIERAGRRDTLKLYSVDCDDEDIARMTAPGSPWVATVTTDPTAIGRLAARALAALIVGEQLPQYLLAEPVLITQQFLRERRITTLDELVRAMPQLAESELLWFDWIRALLQHHGHPAPLLNSQIVDALHASEANLRATVMQQQQLIATINELSTPVVPVYNQILILPLIGVIDSRRSMQIMDELLSRVQHHHARFIIIDITGVSIIDTAVAGYLMRAVQAVKLLGGECVLVGMAPEIAQTIVQLGVDLEGLSTRSTMQAGIAYALARQGLTIAPLKRAERSAL